MAKIALYQSENKGSIDANLEARLVAVKEAAAWERCTVVLTYYQQDTASSGIE